MFPSENSTVNDFADNQFVVDDTQAQWVKDILGAAVTEKERDTNLRLVLITVEDIGHALRNVGAAAEQDLDTLLVALRKKYAGEHPGESVYLGKNRAVQVQLFPYPNAGIPPVNAASIPVEVEKPPERDVASGNEPRPGTGMYLAQVDTDIALYRFAGDQRIIAREQDVLQPGTEPPAYWMGHATSVAEQILKRAPGAKLVVRSVQKTGNGTDLWQFAGTLASFAEPLDENGTRVQIVNCSMGVTALDGAAPLAIERAVAALTRAGITLVAAVGNHGAAVASHLNLTEEQRAALPARDAVMYPAALPDVVGVGAFDDERRLPADFNPSTPGPSGTREPVKWIDFLAPGVNVVSKYLEGPVSIPKLDRPGESEETEFKSGWAKWSGTSFAAAAVTGALAATASVPGQTVRDALYLLSRKAVNAEGIRPA